MLRIGNGDVHRLVEGRKLVLGGFEVPHTKGVLGIRWRCTPTCNNRRNNWSLRFGRYWTAFS